jgi:hypothetical protein
VKDQNTNRLKGRKITIIGEKIACSINDFRTQYLKKGYDLVDVTQLLEFKLGFSGWCNELNFPDELIYHLQVWYRDEQIATWCANVVNVIDDSKYVIYSEEDKNGNDFIMFRKVKIEKSKN